MAFVNLPPNLQDMFYALSDRIAKLETGPNQAMYTADTAQVSASTALADATAALAEADIAIANANIAIANAASANAAATSAAFAAGVSQASANGKNTIYYSSLVPTNTTATITNVVGNGTTVTYTATNTFSVGQLITIAGVNPTAYNLVKVVVATASSTQFTITSTAIGTYVSGGTATNVFVSGDVWFQLNGSNNIIAQSTYQSTLWVANQITDTVVANLNASKITAGQITGIAYNNGSGTFSVSALGVLVASSATITGNITATSGTFTGTVYASAGTFTGTVTATSGSFTGSLYSTSGIIGGFYVGSTYLSSASGGTGFYISSASGAASLGIVTATSFSAGGTFVINSSSSTISGGSYTVNNLGTVGCSNLNASSAITATGELYGITAGSTTTTSTANTWISTGGLFRRSTASSERYKENIADIRTIFDINPRKLLDLPVRAFTYKENNLSNTDDRYKIMMPGFIAEEVDAIYPIAADYENGPESWNDRIIVPAMLALIQDQEARITLLEGK